MPRDRLTARHRHELLALRAALATEFARVWPDVDAATFGRLFPVWEETAYRLTAGHRDQAASLARQYLLALRRQAGVRSRFEPAQMSTLDREAFATSMRATAQATLTDAALAAGTSQDGPAAVRTALAAARGRALVVATGAATRHVLNGARSTLTAGVRDDPRALGWARVTDGSPCAFCALLAARGPVYKDQHSARYAAAGDRYHDHCACFPKPIYDRTADWPGRAREFRDIWIETTRGLHGAEAVNAFRRAYEAA